MTKKKGSAIGRKRIPNVDLNHQKDKEKSIQKNNQIPTSISIEIQRRRTLEFLGGNEMPQNFNHREKQLNEITQYIEECFKKKNKNKFKILMVTGSPGAGKTLSVTHALKKLENQNIIYKAIKFNANIIKTVRDVQQIICHQILATQYGNNMSTLQIIRLIEQKKVQQKYVIYIEEVQIILQQKTNIFTEDFFSLFSNPNINFMLLGISNTIDALAKYSKNIAISLNQIKNIVFEPYTLKDIVEIIKEKLQIVHNKFKFKIVITDKVLNFIAAKMESLKKGDIRIVLQFLRQLAFKLLPKSAETDITVNQQGYVVSMTLAQNVFIKMKSPKNEIITSLPHTQQIVLIAVYLHILEKDCLYMTKKDTQSKTKWICQSLGLEYHPKMADDGIDMLEQYCIISRSKKHNQERIMLKIGLTEVQVSLEDHKLFRKFFTTDKQ